MKKSDLILPSLQSPIEVGSKVVFIDGSNTLTILNNSFELKQVPVGLSEDIFTVVAINVTVPARNVLPDLLSVANNCIVKNDDGDIVFCSRINIRNIKELGSKNPYRLKPNLD